MRRWILGISCMCAVGAVQAQSYLNPEPPPNSIADRFRLEVDLTYGSYDTQIRLDNTITNAAGQPVTTIPGTEVSGESDLGLASTQTLGSVELTLLPGKHHLIRVNALSMRREAQAVLTRTIRWDNSVYLTGEKVDSHLNLTLAGITYGYMPWRKDRYEVGVTFGIQIGEFNANAEVPSRSLRSSESAVGPIPLLGIEGRYDFTPHWSIDARYQYLSLGLIESAGVDLSGVDGTITDARIAIRWRQNRHLVYGLGYRSFNVEVTAPATDPAGEVSLAMTGPVLFVQASL